MADVDWNAEAITLASFDFLASLQSAFPSPPADASENPWYIAAVVAFAASNRPDAVPLVFQLVLSQVDGHERRLKVARKIRDALFKSGLTVGYPKMINAWVALHEATPEDLRDNTPLRDTAAPKEAWHTAGRAFFDETYGETADKTRTLLDAVCPDFGYFCIGPAYGFAYAFEGATSKVETSYIMVAGLIAIDTPRQIGWHLSGAVRNGASKDQARAIRHIALEVSRRCGVRWRGEVPDID